MFGYIHCHQHGAAWEEASKIGMPFHCFDLASPVIPLTLISLLYELLPTLHWPSQWSSYIKSSTPCKWVEWLMSRYLSLVGNRVNLRATEQVTLTCAAGSLLGCRNA